VIETTLDTRVRGGFKFDYNIFREDGKALLVQGYTKHACLNGNGRVIRPPAYLLELIAAHSKETCT
jgi:acyl-CoA thioester hydrolase